MMTLNYKFSTVLFLLILFNSGYAKRVPYKNLAMNNPEVVFSTFREYFQGLRCGDDNSKNPARKLLKDNDGETLTENTIKDNYNNIINALIETDLSSACRWYRNNHVISDTVVATTLISLLKYDNSDKLKEKIAYHFDYKLITYFSKEIQNRVGNFQSDPKFLKVNLLSLTEYEKEFAQQVLLMKNIPSGIAARLGDTEKEFKLIQKFESSRSYMDKKQLLDTLIYIRSENCIKSIIQSLDNINISQCYYHECYHFPYATITFALRRIFPSEELFKSEFDEIYLYWTGDADSPVKRHNLYIKELLKWADKRGVTLSKINEIKYFKKLLKQRR